MGIRVWINGKIRALKEAKISVFDRGFLYGDGAFETMRSYSGKVFKLERHIERLLKALKTVRIKSPYSGKDIREAVYSLLNINQLKSAYIRMTVTRGEGRFGISYSDRLRPNTVIVAKAFTGYSESLYSRGISAKVVDIRHNERSPLSGIKSSSFLNYILARFEAKEKGFDEAILMNTDSFITEGATSNIFLAKKGSLITPSAESGILCGITRAVIIEIARKLGVKVAQKKVTRRELESADEVFLTNSLVEILPVTRIGPRRIGDGLPGELTKLLHISYQKQVLKETSAN
jgi:branched-chain amino acid aminotransferase